MKKSEFYFNGIHLGTLYEDGTFDYSIDSSQSAYMNIEIVVHTLELIRNVGLDPNFNYEQYIKSYNNFKFKDGFEFKSV